MNNFSELITVIKKYNKLNDEYYNNFELTDDEENQIILKLDELEQNAIQLIIDTIKVDENIARTMFSTQRDKLLDILNRSSK